jgi:hypothetical protein
MARLAGKRATDPEHAAIGQDQNHRFQRCRIKRQQCSIAVVHPFDQV